VADALPPRVSLGPSYWRDRVLQHTRDFYAGVPISKFPEDLRVYEHLLWASRANVVIELGVQYGGSALWFRDRLRGLASYGRGEPLVIAVDVDLSLAPEEASGVVFVEGDIRDPKLPGVVASQIPEGARCLVVEDSAHVYETTMAALVGFARFVPVGGFFVVEDGYLDVPEFRFDDSWPRGVLRALDDWIRSPAGAGFEIRRELELYGMTSNPYGYVQRLT
jgi:cephalosporin hydroxylase